ncbi:DUF1810 domain-containing protein [Spirosoma sp. KNUC1025]|uniref:DUF1810 domain-containing protein n=1 Tax=Spirosoma sp. KNUC1025 TaxID=2894082 RepID=UPI00386792EA|nr:DUF1810 domain-containing protein [Spirosoma sp. KNUC1025]
MAPDYDLRRFLDAQENDYTRALTEIRNARKQSHWMWYIFPQVAGLGFSETTKFYAIKDLNEASAYLQHPVLGKRLIDISQALLAIKGKTANQIMGSPDDMKLKSSMTLFSRVQSADPVFQAVLDKYYRGEQDSGTLKLLGADSRK